MAEFVEQRMRDESVDRAKGILIFLVVLGHVIGMVRYVVGGAAFQFLNQIYTAIYLFHVPAFFFLAGYVSGFFARSERFEGVGKFVGKKVRRLVVPYFVWGVASVVIFLALRGVAGLITQNPAYRGLAVDCPWWQPFLSLLHAGGWPKGQGFVCNGVLWFLPVMFVTSILFEGLTRSRSKVKVNNGSVSFCLLAVGCFVLGGVIQFYGPRGLPWGLSVVPYYLGYMLLGEMVGEKRRLRCLAPRAARVQCRQGRPYLSVISMAALWGIYLGLAWVWPDLGLRSRACSWYVFGIVMALAGSCLTLVTARWLPRVPLLAAFGRASLTIMLAHKFLVLPIQVALQKLGSPGDGLAIGVVALVGSVVVAYGIAALCCTRSVNTAARS